MKEYHITYEPLPHNTDKAKRKEYWEIAKGLQKVDDLITSEYLEEIIKETVFGDLKTEDAVKKIDKYYAELSPSEREKGQSEEADKVSARITALLETSGFKFAPVQLKLIHKELFKGMEGFFPGEYRKINIKKSEEVLLGETVRYGNFQDIPDLLEYDFSKEKEKTYEFPLTSKQVSRLASFISGIWETHPFYEGNTRTISTFFIMYLRDIGIPGDNEPFKKRAKWFRDALVRANYSNIQHGIKANQRPLELFLENVLLETEHDLDKTNLCIPT